MGLHPVWLIFALSVFGGLFGFVGMLVAVPVAAMIGVVAQVLHRAIQSRPAVSWAELLKMTMMSEQLSFKLPIKVARERDAFFVSVANANAVATLEEPATWPQGQNDRAWPKGLRKIPSIGNLAQRERGTKDRSAYGILISQNAGANIVVDDLQTVAGIPPAETRLFHLTQSPAIHWRADC